MTSPEDTQSAVQEDSLSSALSRYRSRIYALNCKMLERLLQNLQIEPNSDSTADMQRFIAKEWLDGEEFDQSFHVPNDIYLVLSDGTSSPLSVHERDELFKDVEDNMNSWVDPELRPVQLPADFKALCGLTNSLTGPGLPRSNTADVPQPFASLQYLCGIFGEPMYGGCRNLEEFAEKINLKGYEIATGVQTGDLEGDQGGTYLCLCRNQHEPENTFKWRWITQFDVTDIIYNNVVQLLEESWKDFLNMLTLRYGDLGQDEM